MLHQEKEGKYIFTSTLQILILTSSIFKSNFFDFLLILEDLGVDNMGNDLYVMEDMKYLVLEALGVDNMKNALGVMKDLMSEFITEQQNEDKLNNEIDDLLDGIDFSQPMDDIDCTQFEVSISFVFIN